MAKGLLGFIQSLFSFKSGGKSCCKECFTLLYPVIDGEANDEQIKYLHDHINDCAPCYKHYEIEKAVKEVVKHRIEKREVPSDLINSIKLKLKN
jgi:anti-sigma factor (TIGR02949 family)